MIEALADAGRILGRPRYVASARRAAEMLWNHAFDPASGELKHELFRGHAQIQGYLDDYALFGVALLAVGEATRESVWQQRATAMAVAMLRRFKQGSALTSTQAGAELPLAPPDAGDHVMPSGRSAALVLLLRLSNATANADYAAAAAGLLADPLLATRPEQWPSAVAALVRFPPAKFASATLPSSADHVHVRGEFRRIGDGKEIAITLDIDPGYHINANPASFDYLIPTRVSFKGLAGIEPRYPPATLIKPRFAPDGLKTYEGTVVIAGGLPVQPSHVGPIEAEIRVQACTDEVCLPPATLTVAVPANSTDH